VRIVASTAVLGRRGMDIFTVKTVFAVLMAFKAELSLRRWRDKQFFVWPGVWPVAGDTVTRAYRSMAVRLFENGLFVAVEAEAAH